MIRDALVVGLRKKSLSYYQRYKVQKKAPEGSYTAALAPVSLALMKLFAALAGALDRHNQD